MTKPLVSMIDDDEAFSTLMERIFVLLGCDVNKFTSIQDLINSLADRPPNMLIVDLNLGDGLSGFDVIRTIREDKHSEVPIIILSGDKDFSNVAHGIELGANDYIVKPPRRENLEELLYHYVFSRNLPKFEMKNYHPVATERSKVNLGFNFRILEVHQTGFTLACDHLISKGANFVIKGDLFNSLGFASKEIPVTVINSEVGRNDKQKFYKLSVEIRPDDETALSDVARFLSQKYSQ